MNLTKIFGIHAAQSILDYSPQKIHNAWIGQNRHDQRLQKLSNTLSELGVQIIKADRQTLDKLSNGKNHQSVVIEVEMPQAKTEDELKQAVSQLTQAAFYLIMDHIQDPHNLGACLRTADAVGVDGVIVTKDQAAGITPTVCKVASGAAELVPVYQVTNLVRTLNWMKQQGMWVIGAAGEAEQAIYQADLSVPIALVVGAEEKGMRRLTREQCDVLVKIPMHGKVDSLNVSVAAGVLMYEVVRQRF
ncbi:MAG: 23S rRNA (guanosine(2251)-2'-O)-methyltransferase RlmB [Methylococcaceae bacterium]